MNESKEIYELLRGMAQRKIDNCLYCLGTGETEHVALSLETFKKPCESCAPWRELVKELCWHEWEDYSKVHRLPNTKGRLSCRGCNTDIYGIRTYGNNIGMFGGRIQRMYFVAPDEFINPDLTTAMEGSRLLIVDLMDRAGMWEGFLLFNEKHSYCRISKQDKSGALRWAMRETDEAWEYCKAEILTDGIYLVPAIRGYLEGRV